jgi:hypothetical protein
MGAPRVALERAVERLANVMATGPEAQAYPAPQRCSAKEIGGVGVGAAFQRVVADHPANPTAKNFGLPTRAVTSFRMGGTNRQLFYTH